MSALRGILFFGFQKLLGGIIGRCDVRHVASYCYIPTR